MSVVNKMLNDLENREQEAVVSADYRPPEKKQIPWILLLLSVLVIAGGAWAYWQFAPELLGEKSQVEVASTPNQPSVASVKQNEDSQITDNQGTAVASQRANINESSLADLQVLAEQGTLPVSDQTSTTIEQPAAESGDNVASVLEQNSAVAVDQSDINSPKEAMADEPDVAQVENTVMEAKLIRGDASTVASDVDEAAPELANNQQPEAPAAMAINLSNDLDSDTLKLAAQKALADKDANKAMTLLGKILNEQPDNANARKQLASLFFANQEQAKAEALLKTGLARNAQQHDMRLMLARLYQQSERSQEALTLLQAISPDVSLNIEYYSQRASLSQRLNDFEQASQDYQTLVDIEPEQAKWWLGVGVSADRLNETGTAVAAYTKALSLNQLDPRVTDFMQERLRGLGR